MSARSARFKHLSRTDRRALARAGASRYLISKIKHHAKLSPRMEKKAARVYRYVNYYSLREAGVSKKDSMARWNHPPSKIKPVIRKMRRYVKAITKMNMVAEQRKKGFKEACNAVRDAMALKEWPVQDVEKYVRQMVSAGPEAWREYQAHKRKHGYISYSHWQQLEAQKKLYDEPDEDEDEDEEESEE